MRPLCVFLMLCTAAGSVAANACDASAGQGQDPVMGVTHAQNGAQPGAQPSPQPSAQPGPPCAPAAPQAATMKVGTRPNAPPSSGKEAANARERNAQGGPLLMSALVMLVIALRRGGH